MTLKLRPPDGVRLVWLDLPWAHLSSLQCLVLKGANVHPVSISSTTPAAVATPTPAPARPGTRASRAAARSSRRSTSSSSKKSKGSSNRQAAAPAAPPVLPKLQHLELHDCWVDTLDDLIWLATGASKSKNIINTTTSSRGLTHLAVTDTEPGDESR